MSSATNLIADAQSKEKPSQKVRYTFFVTEPSAEAIREQGFKNEKGLPHRLLWRLREAIENNIAPRRDTDNQDAFGGPKRIQFSFRADPEIVELIEGWQDKLAETRGEEVSTNETLGFLLDWAAQLPVVQPITSAKEVWRFLVHKYGDRVGLIPLSEVVPDLCNYCAMSDARQWLMDLQDQDFINLRLMAGGNRVNGVDFVMRFERKGKIHQFAFLELLYGFPQLNFVKLRTLLSLNPVRNKRFKLDADVIMAWTEGKTEEGIKYYYRPYAIEFCNFVAKPLAEVTDEDFDRFLQSKSMTELAETTREHKIAVVRSFLRFCDRHGVCSLNLGEGQAEQERADFRKMMRKLKSKSSWHTVMHRYKKVGYLMLESEASQFDLKQVVELDTNKPLPPDSDLVSAYQQFANDFQSAFHQLMEDSLDAARVVLRDGKTTVVIVRAAIAETKLRQNFD